MPPKLVQGDFTKMKFGLLRPIRRFYRWKKAAFWECVCDCGARVDKREYSLVKGRATSCGCTGRPDQRGSNNIAWQGHGELSGDHFNRIRRGAESRDISFNVTIEFLWDLFVRQEGRCALSGRDIQFGSRMKRRVKADITASLDRIDNNRGYEPDNVQWVHRDINRMKWMFTQDHFVSMCRDVARTSG